MAPRDVAALKRSLRHFSQHYGLLAVAFARRLARRKELRDSPVGIMRLYRECKRISDAGGPYLWGGGHGRPLRDTSSVGLDCSGSVSLALWRAGMYSDDWARDSVAFEAWGAAGEGRYHTIYCKPGHIWIRFKLSGLAWRFDTSPHGCQSYGPRLRICPRSNRGFVARHVPGL
jgi:hypothetical protein